MTKKTKTLLMVLGILLLYGLLTIISSDHIGEEMRNYANVGTQQNTKPVSILEGLGLEEVECYTGRFTNEQFRPMVIIRIKNASNNPITKSVHIKGVFIDNEKNEVFFEDNSGYLSATSLQPGLINKVRLVASYGVNPNFDANISCQIFINDQLYKTVKIGKDFL